MFNLFFVSSLRRMCPESIRNQPCSADYAHKSWRAALRLWRAYCSQCIRFIPRSVAISHCDISPTRQNRLKPTALSLKRGDNAERFFQAVTGVVGRCELLCSTFFLCSLLCYMRSCRNMKNTGTSLLSSFSSKRLSSTVFQTGGTCLQPFFLWLRPHFAKNKASRSWRCAPCTISASCSTYVNSSTVTGVIDNAVFRTNR